MVDDKYAGPRLDEEISVQFMEELLQHFKDQKKLHQKYAYKVRGWVWPWEGFVCVGFISWCAIRLFWRL